MSPRILNTRRKQGGFTFRRKVPKRLRKTLDLVEVVRSLKTTSRRVARMRADHLWTATDRYFKTCETDSVTQGSGNERVTRREELKQLLDQITQDFSFNYELDQPPEKLAPSSSSLTEHLKVAKAAIFGQHPPEAIAKIIADVAGPIEKLEGDFIASIKVWGLHNKECPYTGNYTLVTSVYDVKDEIAVGILRAMASVYGGFVASKSIDHKWEAVFPKEVRAVSEIERLWLELTKNTDLHTAAKIIGDGGTERIDAIEDALTTYRENRNTPAMVA
jgi:hypothetical protein